MLIVLLILLSVASFSDTRDATRPSDLTIQMQTIGDMSDNQRQALLSTALEERTQIRQQLVSNLVSQDKEMQLYSAYLLGAYRYAEASQALTSAINLEDESFLTRSRWHLWYWYRYPAMEALIRIGSPCLSPVEDTLSTTNDSATRDKCLYVIASIENDQQVTVAELHRAVLAQAITSRRKRLEEAITVYLHNPNRNIEGVVRDTPGSP